MTITIKTQYLYAENKKMLMTFSNYLQQELTVATYKSLPTLLGINNYQFGHYFHSKGEEGIKRVPANIVIKLANILDEHPGELIEKWGLGTEKITIDQANALVKEYGEVWGRVICAA